MVPVENARPALWACALGLLLAWQAPLLAQEAPKAAEAPLEGSTVSMTPLGTGGAGMSVSAGWALALPFVAFEGGWGLSESVDLLARYEGVMGLLHFVQLGGRWGAQPIGRLRLGARLGLAYSAFGLHTQNLNLTSTLYLTPELGASWRISPDSELLLGLGAELDLARFFVNEGDSQLEGELHYDATSARFGIKSRLTRDLHLFVQGRLRVPTDSITYQQEQFVLVPFLEAGGTWGW